MVQCLPHNSLMLNKLGNNNCQDFHSKADYKYMHKEDSTSKLTVRCVGDIAPVRGALEILGNTGAGEFARQLSKSLPRSDLTVANLEAPVVSQAALRENKQS